MAGTLSCTVNALAALSAGSTEPDGVADAGAIQSGAFDGDQTHRRSHAMVYIPVYIFFLLFSWPVPKLVSVLGICDFHPGVPN
jgi:hypothetical protein